MRIAPSAKKSGAATVSTRRGRPLSTRELLARIYELEDAVEAYYRPIRQKPSAKGLAAVLARVRALREELEDRFDLEEVRKARRESGWIPWEKIKADLGL